MMLLENQNERTFWDNNTDQTIRTHLTVTENKKPSSGAWGDTATQYFYELTPERILDNVERFGVRCTGRCLPLNSMENRVYEVELDLHEDEIERPSDRFRIVKFYRPGRWNREQIQAEHDFLKDLDKAEIPVVPPCSLDEETVLRDDDLGLFFSVTPKMGGRSPDEIDDDLAERCGRLLGRIHQVGKIREAPSRIRLTPETYGLNNLKLLQSSGLMPPEFEKLLVDIIERIVSFSQPLFEGVQYQRIHGDAHIGNIIFGRDALLFVDFDDMLMGPPVQDLWLLLASGDDSRYERRKTLLLSAYEEMCPFDWSTLRLIEPLRALRQIHFAAWIAHRWEDPAFKRTFVHFDSPSYWQSLLADLQLQWQLIVSGDTGSR